MHPIAVALLVSLSIAAQKSGDRKQDEWKRVASRGGGFSVLVPGKVEQKVEREKTDDGVVETHMIISNAKVVTYVATVVLAKDPVTPDKEKQFFDDIRSGYAQSDGRTVLKEERGGKYRGKSTCFYHVVSPAPDGKPRHEHTRFLVGDPTHLYTIQVVYPEGVDVTDDIRRFFDSLEYDLNQAPREATSKVAPPRAPASKAVGAKWRSYTPPTKGFSALMPGEPKVQHQDLPDGPVGIDSYEVDLGAHAFSVAVYTNPPAVAAKPAAENLENLCRGIVRGMKGTLDTIKPAPRSSFEGRAASFTLTNPDTGEPADGRIRVYADGARLLVALYVGPKGSGDEGEANRFLAAFRPTRATPAKGK